MKNVFRASALMCATVCLTLSLSTSPARAWSQDEGNDTVSAAQMRLASLGYYVGRYDGMMGPVTENAIMDFQRINGLAQTGDLNAETYNLLMHRDYAGYWDYYHNSYYQPGYQPGYYHVAYGAPVYMDDRLVAWDDRWHYASAEGVPTRFGRLTINEDDRGSLRHYSVTLNGQPVLFAHNQPGVLRVSKTFTMQNEDNIIFTAYNGDEECSYKNYLLTIHRDGSFTIPREIGNCQASYEAHVADNALFISFPGSGRVGSWTTWDVWRYEDNALIRL